MTELTDDPVYRMLEKDFPELLLDYVLLTADGAPEGITGHREAVLTALRMLDTRERVGNSLRHPPITAIPEKMEGKPYPAEAFFLKNSGGLREDGSRITPETGQMTYWHAFFDPPYGIPYTESDFYRLNAALFPVPLRQNPLQIYSWSGDFTNYFDQGNEWWGTALWSIHDPMMHRFVIIGASLTD